MIDACSHEQSVQTSLGTRRQILTFLFGVLFPGISLIVLGVVLVNQADQISTQRAEEAGVLKAREIADSAHQRLERGYEGVLRRPDTWHLRHPLQNSLVLVGMVESSQFSIPAVRLDRSSMSVEHRAFIQRVRARALQGESGPSLRASIDQRLTVETAPSQRQELLVEYGKFLSPTESVASIFVDEPVVLDGTGTPFGLYAVEQDVAREQEEASCDYLQHLVATNTQLSTAGWTYFLDLAGQTRCFDEHQTRQIEYLLALIQELESRSGGIPAGVNGSEWVVSEGGWLVRMVDPRIDEAQPVVAIALSDMNQSLANLGVDSLQVDPDHRLESEGWNSLEPLFSAVSVLLSENVDSAPRRPWLLFLGILIVLAMTTGGSMLLWQDNLRDKRLRSLQNQFVASVSHELRTPLTSIRIFSEAMLQYGSIKPDEQEKGLRVIAYESGRLSRMLNNVLSASRLESTTYAFNKAPGDLADAAESASEAMRMEYENAGVQLTKSLEMARASFDPDAMEQVILNLLSNALKYGASEQSVELATWESKDHAHIRVTDHGPGIPEDAQERLFERFYRSESTKTSVVGTGLGLWLVKEIVDAHQGSIEVVSVPGQGASFVVQIPVNR